MVGKKRKIELFDIINKLLLFFMAMMCILPFYYVVVVSFSDPMLVREGKLILVPKKFSLKAYEMILRQPIFYNAFTVTIIRTILGTFLNLLLQCTMAYSLSKKRLIGRNVFTFMLLFTILFNGGMIPTYLVVRYTKLINTIWALIIPNAINAWNILILINFFASIPESIEESASIDGANDFTIFFRLILPLAIPGVATIALFIAVYHWNNLMDGVLYINTSSLKPLQVYLRDLVMRSQMQDMFQDAGEQTIPSLTIQTAAIFASTFPILLVYPFVQRYFVKGIMIGAVKG